jgi:type III restriction enzyme
MDAGAHYRKCDLQVHTPRDPQWSGTGAVTEADRQAYAAEFVAACRAKGLGAVAITDHHDLAFFPFIREAAFGETDASGRPLSEQERLVVLPGMELTLGVPCQALLLLDADFPNDLLDQVVHAIDVTPTDASRATHAPTERLEHFQTIEDVYETLNKKDFLRGRFIVLPHVGKSGQASLLRKGMASKYKTMPSVGGYLDGLVSQHGDGQADIVAGKDKQWGNRAIALIQTSDNRSRDFANLGSAVTWIKWAQPTAEALRQACLARESRIAHSEPCLPSLRITSLEVSNSKFMGPISLAFNPQYNALIGGRGTGKSTVLEYIRWALCDQPPVQVEGDEELPDYQKRRKSLIDGTLRPLDAEVELSFLLNDVAHVVRRKVSGELLLQIGNGAFQSCSEQNVRDLLPVRAYSQKQLSAVGARIEELRRFVQAPIRKELDVLAGSLNALRTRLREGFEQVRSLRTLEAEVTALTFEQSSLQEQVLRLRNTLSGLASGDAAVITRQSGYEQERRLVQALRRDEEALRSSLRDVSDALGAIEPRFEASKAPENGELLRTAQATLTSFIGTARKSIESLRDMLAHDPALNPLREGLSAWDAAFVSHQHAYEEAKLRTAAHEATLKEINALESRLAEAVDAIDGKRRALERLSVSAEDFAQLRREWAARHAQRATLLEGQCAALTTGAESRLRASLRRATDTGPLAERMRALLRGTGTRGERIEKLLGAVRAAADPFDAWQSILDELFLLVWLSVEDEERVALPATPLLDQAGFTRRERIALTRQMDPSDWLELLLFDLEDVPVFEYEVKRGDFIPFENASPGQQATALLAVLLLQDGPPLLIDQPEDDLNMKIINETVETLWRAKSHRQILFASHNANLVVNGDAELVVCCDYRSIGTESGGHIKAIGAIDMPSINAEIADVMEGGLNAFKLRWQKYGF